MPFQTGKMVAPTRGWNDRDNIALMEQGYAVVLDNINPKSRECVSRGGTEQYANIPTPSSVKTLMTYEGQSSQFFACAGNTIYNITTSTPSVSLASRTSDINDHVMFSTVTDKFMYVVNGNDAPVAYNGTTWITPAFTYASGTTPPVGGVSSFFALAMHGRTLFFLERNSLTFWYLDVNSIQGDLRRFDLGPIFEYGGNVCAIGSWSRDSGNGASDLLCIFTDRGEVAIYQGDNPAQIDSFSIVGIFKIGVPAGFPQDGSDPDHGINSSRVMLKIGADLFIITSYGLLSMSQILNSALSSESTSVSDTIKNSFSTSYEAYKNKFGWQALEYPKGSLLVVNVPNDKSEEPALRYNQYVMNTINESWCRWTGLNYLCWGMYKQEIYCGGTLGSVVKSDTGNNDLGVQINCAMVGAYDDFQSIYRKKFIQLRSFIETGGDTLFTLDVDVDYEFNYQQYKVLLETDGSSLWGSAVWGANKWSQTVARANTLTRLSHIGTSAAIHCFFQTFDTPVIITSFNLNYSVSTRI